MNFFFSCHGKNETSGCITLLFLQKTSCHDVAWKERKIFIRAKDHDDTVIFLLFMCALPVQKLSCLARHPRSILA
jgi:hypothetical protein